MFLPILDQPNKIRTFSDIYHCVVKSTLCVIRRFLVVFPSTWIDLLGDDKSSKNSLVPEYHLNSSRRLHSEQQKLQTGHVFFVGSVKPGKRHQSYELDCISCPKNDQKLDFCQQTSLFKN